LDACQKLDRALIDAQISELLKQSPDTPEWPFGMATSINPYLLFIGISPGAGKISNPAGYWKPSAGIPYNGGWNPPGHFWKSLRNLAIRIMQGVKSDLTKDECLALSGLLNLGTRNDAHPNERFVTEGEKYIKWIPTAIQMLKPKIVITLGLKGICVFPVVRENWKASILAKLLAKPDCPNVPFEWGKRYCFEKRLLDDGTLVVAWPNHLQQPPFLDSKALDKAADLFIANFVNVALKTGDKGIQVIAQK
jgi:hypothetical protein